MEQSSSSASDGSGVEGMDLARKFGVYGSGETWDAIKVYSQEQSRSGATMAHGLLDILKELEQVRDKSSPSELIDAIFNVEARLHRLQELAPASEIL